MTETCKLLRITSREFVYSSTRFAKPRFTGLPILRFASVTNTRKSPAEVSVSCPDAKSRNSICANLSEANGAVFGTVSCRGRDYSVGNPVAPLKSGHCAVQYDCPLRAKATFSTELLHGNVPEAPTGASFGLV